MPSCDVRPCALAAAAAWAQAAWGPHAHANVYESFWEEEAGGADTWRVEFEARMHEERASRTQARRGPSSPRPSRYSFLLLVRACLRVEERSIALGGNLALGARRACSMLKRLKPHDFYA